MSSKVIVGLFVLSLLAVQASWGGWLDSVVESAAKGAAENIVNRGAQESSDAAYDKAKQGAKGGSDADVGSTSSRSSGSRSSSASASTRDPNDAAGSQDPPFFSRMPGFHINNYQELDFDRYDFPVASGKVQAVEGRHYYVDYYANDGIKLPSALQITRNYSNAAKSVGGKVIYEYEDGGAQFLTLKLVKDDAEAWAFVEGVGNGMYKIHVIEKQLMQQAVEADASSLAATIRETGKAAVYGIYFDTAKSTIKPQSAAAISEISGLLRNDSGLKLYVVGHTDNVGAFDYNVKLSQSRAAAVVEALTRQHGISGSRLTPFGAGPTSPAASNKSEEGRARNRRVELVAQ